MNKLSLFAALALGGLLAGSTLATAQESKEGKDAKAGKRGFPSVQQRLDRMTEELKLTDEQKPKVKAVLEDNDKKMRDLPPDERRTKFRDLREEMAKKMKEILNSEQFEKWEKMRGPRGPGSPLAPGGEKKSGGEKKDEGAKKD